MRAIKCKMTITNHRTKTFWTILIENKSDNNYIISLLVRNYKIFIMMFFFNIDKFNLFLSSLHRKIALCNLISYWTISYHNIIKQNITIHASLKYFKIAKKKKYVISNTKNNDFIHVRHRIRITEKEIKVTFVENF